MAYSTAEQGFASDLQNWKQLTFPLSYKNSLGRSPIYAYKNVGGGAQKQKWRSGLGAEKDFHLQIVDASRRW